MTTRDHQRDFCLTRLLALAVAGLCLASASVTRAADEYGTSLAIASDPTDATVWVNGELRGSTPLTLTNLPPGEHLLTVRKPRFRELNQNVALPPQGRRALDLRLEAITGLVLVHSTPVEAEVIVGGAVQGKTPLLLTRLPLGTHRMRLALPGYQPREVDIDIEGRTPQIVRVALTSDSATLHLSSEPTAEVVINGVPRGVTPLTIDRITEGNVEVEIAAEGYIPFRQTLRLSAGDSETLDIELLQRPATLNIESLPTGARVYIDNQFRGLAPLTLDGLAPTTYRVRAELPGHDPLPRNVTLTRGAVVTEEFRLTPNTGSIELTTEPAGVTAYIDGRLVGTSAAPEEGTDRLSEPLRIEGVSVGTSELRLSRRGFFERTMEVEIERGRTLTLHAALQRRFIPNYEVTTDRRVYRGLLDSVTQEYISLETAPGIFTPIPVKDVRNHRHLREDEIAEDPAR